MYFSSLVNMLLWANNFNLKIKSRSFILYLNNIFLSQNVSTAIMQSSSVKSKIQDTKNVSSPVSTMQKECATLVCRNLKDTLVLS